MQNFITIFFTVIEIGPFSLFQNLELGKASTHKNVSSQSLGLDLSISMFTHKFIKIFHSVQEIGPFSPFQDLYTDSSLRKALAVNQMNSSFPISYLKFTKYVTNIIAEPKYKYGQQQQITVRNHNRSTTLERPALRYWGA